MCSAIVTPLYQDLRYTFYANGNVQTITDPLNANQDFSYDQLDRLMMATGPYGASGATATLSYDYAQIGNMTLNSQVSATTYGYPASGASSVRPHAVTTAGANTYTYDANGNMTAGAGRTIAYSQENKPLTITFGGVTTAFVYDGEGTRLKKIAGSSTVTRYISKLYECDNGSCSRYVWANNARIATIAVSNGTVNYWHQDHLGSSAVITDGAGNKVETITYYPYGGTRTNVPGTPVNVPYKYTGQELDSTTGLYDYGARQYEPVLGRFTSSDTIVPDPRDPQSLNRYSYAQNNPLRYIDPSGHEELPSDFPTIQVVCFPCGSGGTSPADMQWSQQMNQFQ